LVSLLVV